MVDVWPSEGVFLGNTLFLHSEADNNNKGDF